MTSGSEPVELHPFFLDGSAGRLFCLSVRPTDPAAGRPAVLLVPPFAEELNKTRRQINLTARALAARGLHVLIPDLYGTGDSEGDFVDARWETWLDDLRATADWLQHSGSGTLVLWCVRAGALLLPQLLESLERRIDRLLLWQPVVDGQQYLNQFLRLRVAANMLAGEQQETTAGLIERLEGGAALEIAGYELHPQLADAIAAARLTSAHIPDTGWFEVVAAEDRPVAFASRKIQDAWRDSEIPLHADTVVGELFWQTPEIAVVPQLVDRSCEYLTGEIS